MPRKPPIRITNKDRQLISKINARVSSKKSYLRGKGLEVEGVDTKGVTSFSTRDEFNRYVEQMSTFTKRSANRYHVRNEEGVRFQKRELNQVEREIRKINRRKKLEFDRVKNETFKDRKTPTELKVKDQAYKMGDARYSSIKPLTFNPNRFRSKKEFEQYKKGLKNTYKGDFIARRQKMYKANYLTALENVFGFMGKDYKELAKHVEAMNPQDLIDKSYTTNIGKLDFIYDRLELEARLSEIRSLFDL